MAVFCAHHHIHKAVVLNLGDKFMMENEQRIDVDASEKSDESVCVRIEAENNGETAVELEPDSTAVFHGRGRRGNTIPVTSKKRGGGGRVVSAAWNHFKKVKLGEEVQAICNYCGLVMFMIYAFLLDGIPEEAILFAEHLIDESLMSEQQSNEVDD